MRKKQYGVGGALILAHLRKVRDVSPIDAHLLLRQERNALQSGAPLASLRDGREKST